MAKTSNKQKINNFIKFLDDNGYKAYNIEYGNGYFIFEYGKDTVCHFKIKGCKNWQFGIWLDVDKDSPYELQFFFQYIKDVDKFKPSASNYCYKISKYNTANELEFMNMLNALKIVKKYSSVARNLGVEEWKPKWKCILENFKLDFDDFIYKKKEIIKSYLYYFLFFKFNPKIKYCKLIDLDKNDDNLTFYPRFNIKYIPIKKIALNNKKYNILDEKLEKISYKFNASVNIYGEEYEKGE